MSEWKKDDNGNLVLKDGNPVYIGTDGREMTVETTTISNLRGEAKGHREKAEAAEKKLKDFEGIDPAVARKAVETVSKIDAKALIDAGKVDEVKNQITQQFQAQLAEKDTALSAVQAKLNNMMIDGVFSNSRFVRDNIAIPSDIFRDSFSKHFKIEEGEIVAYDKAGNRMYSKSRAGEWADPEEALQILVDAHPQKDTLLRPATGGGSGNKGAGAGRGPGRAMSRAEFEQLAPGQQLDHSQKVLKGEVPALTD